ncbi:MAG TPA: peptide-methionine (S)-S-oxide reductase, partial [Puia sp.]|nr:peptide-methionine (S)-S-oxide reductase [Puia sp.]
MIFLSALTTMALISASGGTTAGAAASGGTAISNGATDSGVGVSGPAVSGGTKGDETIPGRKKTATAYFGTGCFWCTEAVFQELKGVEKVTSGYSGGSAVNPSYEEVCTGTTGHAECLRVVYDPAVITYDELL